MTLNELAVPAPAARDGDVSILRWPAQESLRQRLAAEGRPRLLLLTPHADPPEHWEELEDWIREPLHPTELETRLATLRRRARRPVFEAGAMVRLDDQWVAIPPTQAAVAALLVERYGSVVLLPEIVAAYRRSGGSGERTAVKAMLSRLQRRLATVGLRLRNVRGSGYLLEVPPLV